jgi:hypothetical protein
MEAMGIVAPSQVNDGVARPMQEYSRLQQAYQNRMNALQVTLLPLR